MGRMLIMMRKDQIEMLTKKVGEIDALGLIEKLKFLGVGEDIKFIDIGISIPKTAIENIPALQAELSSLSKVGRSFKIKEEGERLVIDTNSFNFGSRQTSNSRAPKKEPSEENKGQNQRIGISSTLNSLFASKENTKKIEEKKTDIQGQKVMSRRIVVLAGPGGDTFSKEDVAKISMAMRYSAGAEIINIGDGVDSVSKDQIRKIFNYISKVSTEPLTIFVMAHGVIRNGRHVIDTHGNEQYELGITSAELFDAIHDSFQSRPVDVFMTCCHGGAAVAELNRLHNGSTLIVLAPENEEVVSYDIMRLADNITASIMSGDLSANHLINLYLAKCLETRIAPSIAIAGAGKRDLLAEFRVQIGKPFSDNEKDRIHRELDSVVGSARVDEIMDKISNARNEYDGIGGIIFGPALAIVLHSRSIMDPSLQVSVSPTAGKK